MGYRTFTEAFNRIEYPAGEGHIVAKSIEELRSVDTIEAKVHTFTDLCEVVTADRILRRNGIEIEWFIPYFPFARHDRRIDESDGFEVELALQLVAELNLVVADPHSELTAVLRHIPQADMVEVVRAHGAFANDPVVIIPDAGAAKKAGEWLAGAEPVQALKHREPRTGRLDGFRVLADDLGGQPCVIVDDICDGGGTFLGLAAELQTHNVGPLTLIVTHGLFTKGLDDLTRTFDAIWAFASTEETQTITTDGCLTRLPFKVLYKKGTPR